MIAAANTMSGDTNTGSNTLWTLTLMEALYDALSNEGSDREILSTVNELYACHLDNCYLLTKVKYHLGVMEMLRLKILIATSC